MAGNEARTVLVVDDDEAIRSLITATLMAEGYTVKVARAGESVWPGTAGGALS